MFFYSLADSKYLYYILNLTQISTGSVDKKMVLLNTQNSATTFLPSLPHHHVWIARICRNRTPMISRVGSLTMVAWLLTTVYICRQCVSKITYSLYFTWRVFNAFQARVENTYPFLCYSKTKRFRYIALLDTPGTFHL